MKSGKKVIHIVRHEPTGADIPMIIRKVNLENVITDYVEHIEKRKGFTLAMLEKRWDMERNDILNLLKTYQVPGHVDHKEVQAGKLPQDVAIFFEEYVFGIEKKAGFSHNKLKSKEVGN